MNQPSSTPPTPASSPGTVNVRINPKALVGGVVAAIAILSFGFKLGANGSANATNAPAVQDVDENQTSTLDEGLPALDPTEGPDIAPTPTTLAETPIELDPVVTTIAEPAEPPATNEPASSLQTSAITMTVSDSAGQPSEVALPEGWVFDDKYPGNAYSEGPPWMNVYILNKPWNHDESVPKYQKFLAESMKDAKFTKPKSLPISSNIVAFSYFEYEGVMATQNGGSRAVYGFVLLGTYTNGTTWIVDWWSDSDVQNQVATDHFNFFMGIFNV